MPYFVALYVDRMPCLVVGAGVVGFRKTHGVLTAGAQDVLVLDSAGFDDKWQALRGNTCVHLEKRAFEERDVEGRYLVFACTSQRTLNASIATLCAQRGILCNCTDAPSAGSFLVPAVASAHVGRPDDCAIQAALSTEGASPAWSRALKTELEQWLLPHAPMTALLGRLRPLVLAMQEKTAHNTECFSALVASPLHHALAQGDKAECVKLLESILPMPLQKHIAELLHDII